MSYQFVATITQTAALLLFIALTVTVLVYAFWPGNSQRFEAAQRRALELKGDETRRGDRT